MDNQDELTQLLKAYQAKGMTAEAAHHSLAELGYTEEEISGGLQAASYSTANDPVVNPPPISNSPEWTEVGNDILNEKRGQSRTIAQGFVFLVGGAIGVRAYFLFWQTKQEISASCKTTSFPVLKANPCYQQKVNPDKVFVAAIAGALIALIIVKICYLIADRLRRQNQ